MKTYITKGTGINTLSTKVKIDPASKEPIRGQFYENKILLVEGIKYWTKDTDAADEFYADVFFIFNFPQRKITKALKEITKC
jgi:hypothetical protein